MPAKRYRGFTYLDSPFWLAMRHRPLRDFFLQFNFRLRRIIDNSALCQIWAILPGALNSLCHLQVSSVGDELHELCSAQARESLEPDVFGLLSQIFHRC